MPPIPSYIAASGQPVYGGRFPSTIITGTNVFDSISGSGSLLGNLALLTGTNVFDDITASGNLLIQPSSLTALVGDSLTANSYELTMATWLGGVAGGVLQPVLNAGVAGETWANVLARIDNSYTNASPGLAGLAASFGQSKIGFVKLLLGTNDARNLSNYSAIASTVTSLMAKLAGYADHTLIISVPPMGSPEANFAAKNACTIDINTGLAAYAAANPLTCSYIEAASAIRVGGVPSGAAIATGMGDGVHYANSNLRKMGIQGGDGFAALLAAKGWTYTSPLVTSNSDSYNANPGSSTQWADNPAMLGSNVSGGFTGQVVNGMTVGSSGAGAGTCSIIAAAGGDPNQTPWQRITPTQGQNTGWTQVSMSTHGRAITSVDPSIMEALVQVRFNALDVTSVKRLTFAARGNTSNNQYLLPQFWLGLGPEAATVTKTVTMRSKLPRGSGVSESGISLFLALEYLADFSGANIGSFDVRCGPTLRG